MGLGGYQVQPYYDRVVTDSYATVASTLNSYINGKVTNMASKPTGGQTAYYPVGIVLMNYVTDYSTVVNNILQLNNKFEQAMDETWSQSSSSSTSKARSVATGYSSGMVDNGTQAIGWDTVE